jgi:hypothetical protein
VVAVIGLNYLFYKFTINFLQYWWFGLFVVISFIFSYFFKKSLYYYLTACKNFKYYLYTDIIYTDINDVFAVNFKNIIIFKEFCYKLLEKYNTMFL